MKRLNSVGFQKNFRFWIKRTSDIQSPKKERVWIKASRANLCSKCSMANLPYCQDCPCSSGSNRIQLFPREITFILKKCVSWWYQLIETSLSCIWGSLEPFNQSWACWIIKIHFWIHHILICVDGTFILYSNQWCPVQRKTESQT